MRRLLFFFLTAGVLFLPRLDAADNQNTPISVKAEVDRAAITIGDPVKYSVIIQSAPNVQILSPIPYPPKDIFQIKKIEEIKNEDAGQTITGKKFTLTAYQLGEFILEPVEVEYRIKGAPGAAAGGDEIKKIQTSRIFITVKSVSGGKPQTDIRGLKAILSIPLNVLGIGLAVAAGILLILIPMIYRIWKKRSALPPAPKVILTAEEEAIGQLNQLFDSELLREGRTKEYFFRLSEILRFYLEKRYKIAAVESTTFEIVRMFRSVDVSNELRNKIREVLEASDLAKFAKYRPEPAEILNLNKQSKEIVEASRPREASGGV